MVLVGSESTGKTTLAQALAELFHTEWVSEYGRQYTEERHAGQAEQERGLGESEGWTTEEFVHIAEVQQQLEDAAAARTALLFCDTNAFATAIWHERYMGFRDPRVDAIAARDTVDLYILTGNDVPFVPDDIRDGETLRDWMFERFLEDIRAMAVPYLVVTGTHDQRIAQVVQALEDRGIRP